MSPKLDGVHPALVVKVNQIMVAMAALGFTMLVTDGVRTEAEQAALYAKGRTAPGPRVTNVDGELKRSNHQTKADGYGYAVDCCFVVNGKPSWDRNLPWKLYGEAAKALGLIWGGDWKTITDWPHIEIPS